jgi:hypothetical protein
LPRGLPHDPFDLARHQARPLTGHRLPSFAPLDGLVAEGEIDHETKGGTYGLPPATLARSYGYGTTATTTRRAKVAPATPRVPPLETATGGKALVDALKERFAAEEIERFEQIAAPGDDYVGSS